MKSGTADGERSLYLQGCALQAAAIAVLASLCIASCSTPRHDQRYPHTDITVSEKCYKAVVLCLWREEMQRNTTTAIGNGVIFASSSVAEE